MQFDQLIDRRGTQCMKWDGMSARFGVAPEGGIPMWVADMDFRSPDCVQAALARMLDHGVFGYPDADAEHRAAVRWWMSEQHLWEVPPEAIFTVHGLVNGTALCVECWTRPGEGVVLFTPVYHAFARVITAAGRQVVECPLKVEDGRHAMDFEAWDAQMTGNERMVVLCSPHNPGGRVWSEDELRSVAEFAARHDLILVSDEIHHDLVYPGHHHVVMANAAPDYRDRLVMLTAASKTFNIAGAHVGNVIITDPGLRAEFGRKLAGLGISPNSFGLAMATAAYSPDGAMWLQELIPYLDANRRQFDEGIAAIRGARSMPLEATYLAWVDFSDLGLTEAEVFARVEGSAQIAANHGPTFGTGGAGHLRFNFAMPRTVVQEAVVRLQQAFADI